jgi:diphthine synthase
MTASTAAELLAGELGERLAVAVCRAGSPDPVVVADSLPALAKRAFGDPLHMLVLPGDLHHVEREALAALAGAPERLLPADD